MIQFNNILPHEIAIYFSYYLKISDILNLGEDEKETQELKNLMTAKINVTEENLYLVVKLKNECFKKIAEIEIFTEKAKSKLNEISNLNNTKFLQKWK